MISPLARAHKMTMDAVHKCMHEPPAPSQAPRHDIDGIDGMDVELQWANGRGEIARLYLLFRGNEYDISDIVRTNRDGSLTTLVEDLFEEIAELRREDVEEHDMSEASERKAG